MSKKIPNIKYTSRDFDSIKTDLLNYAKKYYPNNFQDFNESSFGSLMLDTVSYVGDILSFYLDYQSNESFIDSAIEKNNILKLGAGLGYRPKTAISAEGIVTLYVSVPPNNFGTDINEDYLPIIKRGTTFGSAGGSKFTLTEDVVINKDTAEIRKSRLSPNAPFAYVAKIYGKVISGVEQTVDVEVGDFERFKKVQVGDNTIAEILSITDLDGNEYYEVDYLTQNIIYREIDNPNTDSSEVKYILKPISVVRRFIVIREEDKTYVQFGGAANMKIRFTRDIGTKEADFTGQRMLDLGLDNIHSGTWFFKANKGQPVGLEVYHAGKSDMTVTTREFKMWIP